MKRIIALTIVFITAFMLFSGCKRNETTEVSAYKAGDTIELGCYPQSKVENSTLISELNSIELKWISFEYMIWEDNTFHPDNYMKFADVNYEGEKYRAVTFSRYRTENPKKEGKEDDSNQYENGYKTDEIYWFKYEPVKWTVLDAKKGLILSKTVIDARAFSETVYEGEKVNPVKHVYYNDAQLKHEASDYKTSSLREWLTDDFYNIFSESEKTLMNEAKLNDIKINDYIFILSYEDIKNTDYGFSSNGAIIDESKRATATDYAKCQGVACDFYGNASWILRTPVDSGTVCGVYEEGFVVSNCNAGDTFYGVRPAMHVDLSKITKTEE